MLKFMCEIEDNLVEVEEQIKIREELMTQLGGQLYRSIVFDELVILRRKYWEIK